MSELRQPEVSLGQRVKLHVKAKVLTVNVDTVLNLVVTGIKIESSSEGYYYKYQLQEQLPSAYYTGGSIVGWYQKKEFEVV